MEKLDAAERDRCIAAFVARASGERDVQVSGVQRLAGGSSRQVWSVDVSLAGRSLPLVLRINPTPGGTSVVQQSTGGFDAEFELLRVVQDCGAPIPRVHWACEDPEPLGGPFYLMDRIEGETIPRRIYRSEELRDARAVLPEQLGRALACIHSVELAGGALDWLPGPPEGRSSPWEQVESIRRGLEASPGPAPVLELAYRFLHQNVPEEHARTLVHGDYRIGNVVVDAKGLAGVLDWELAHRGDPHEDLAWMCTKTWRFGNVAEPVGGLGQREPFYTAYERESGRALDREALRYWELLCSAKVAVVWIVQVQAYLTGAAPSVEKAAIGRRKAETELDLLELLEAV